jgi:hypothetical protein
MYHYVTICAVMRDCTSTDDAIRQCGKLMPQYPDETTKHMESWVVVEVSEPSTGKVHTVEPE